MMPKKSDDSIFSSEKPFSLRWWFLPVIGLVITMWIIFNQYVVSSGIK